MMLNYFADPDIRAILDSEFEIPDGLESAEVERLLHFVRCDQALEVFYRDHPGLRPPQSDLTAAASAAMTAYDQRSERLPVGWQKFLVLQAGIAGREKNLDSLEIQEWAYSRIKDEHPDWLGTFDEDLDREMPLRWLTEEIGTRVLWARQHPAAQSAPTTAGRVATGGCAAAALSGLALLGVLVWLT